jgi:hypothetical protein
LVEELDGDGLDTRQPSIAILDSTPAQEKSKELGGLITGEAEANGRDAVAGKPADGRLRPRISR